MYSLSANMENRLTNKLIFCNASLGYLTLSYLILINVHRCFDVFILITKSVQKSI